MTFGVFFGDKPKQSEARRIYDRRRRQLERTIRATMDPLEAEKQERRILRMLKNGVTLTQFEEIDISLERVRAIAAKHGHDMNQNLERPWRTPANKLKPPHLLKRGRR